MVYKKSISEYIFDGFNYLFLSLLVVITLYPCLYVLFASVSDPKAIYDNGGILLRPVGFDIYTYKAVFKNTMIWSGYKNTIIYVIFGATLSVFLTISASFGLTRKGLPYKNLLLMMIVFTMYFSGGLIPTYLVVKGLNITDTPFAMLLPTAVSTYNLIITMTYFRNLPDSLEEAAKIDGASDYTVFFRIMIPLAKPIIAVIALYYSVAIWNNYFQALIYLSKRELFPLQLILREILIQNDTAMMGNSQMDNSQTYAENIKYATIVVSTVPILCVYPFVQKYFVKGVMIGAVKG